MATDNPGQRDDTLEEAISEAQRTAREDQRWKAHLELHDLAARLRSESGDQRWDGHYREHALHDTAHIREHEQTQLALDKAEKQVGNALDKAENTVSLRFDAIGKASDVMRDQVTEINRGGARQEGKGLGQTATIAIIVGAVSFVGAILGIVIVVANFVSAS